MYRSGWPESHDHPVPILHWEYSVCHFLGTQQNTYKGMWIFWSISKVHRVSGQSRQPLTEAQKPVLPMILDSVRLTKIATIVGAIIWTL